MWQHIMTENHAPITEENVFFFAVTVKDISVGQKQNQDIQVYVWKIFTSGMPRTQRIFILLVLLKDFHKY